jgi:4-carboxymuconolactone decarboxylase
MAKAKKTTTARAGNEMHYAVLPDRMPPLTRAKMTAAQKEAADAMIAGPRGFLTGSYQPILRSPGLMRPLDQVGAYVRFKCTLKLRINEMAAVMAARHWTQQYEWEAHCRWGRKFGVKQSIIDAIAEGRRPEKMARDETVVYDFFTELFANKSVSDPTYARAVAEFGERGVIDLLGVVGYYTFLAMVMNVARTPAQHGAVLPLVPMPQQMCIKKRAK